MSEPKVSPSEVQSAVETGAQQQRLRSVTPTWADVQAELKTGVDVRELPNGQTEARIDLKGEDAERRRRVLHGMFESRRLMETDYGLARSAAIPATVLRDRDGNERTVPAAQAERVARKTGMHERPFWGRPHRRYVRGKWYVRRGDGWYEEGSK